MFTKFYGIGSLPPECQQLIKKYSFFFFLTNFCVLFVYAFIILHLIDLFGVFTGGFLFSILLFVSFLFDFVTGVISDRIGQKNILLLSISCSICFYYLLSVFQSFNEIFLIMVIGGIGVALRSGALETWFFNNYKILVSDADPERKIFGFFSARVRIISNWVAMATGVFIGSNIVFYFSLSFAFRLNSFNYILFFFFVLLFLNNYKDENNKEMNNHESVIKIFYSSIIYIFNHKPLLVYIIGYLLWLVSFGIVFLNLIIYPIFTGYTDNPQTFGMLLTSTPIIAFFAGFVVSYLSNKITNERLPKIALLYNLTLHSCYIVLLIIFPLNQTLNVTAIIIIIIFSLISESFFGELGINLVQRINLDIIPSDYRNSILSIISSILTLLTSILLVILGLIIAKTSLMHAILALEVIGIIGSIFFAISFVLEKHHSLNISQAEQPQFS